jgi:hypothetical protein
MRITTRSDDRGRLAVQLGLRPGSRIAMTSFGLAFAAFGAFAAFVGLPHTESLHCVRTDRVVCTSAQLLAGTWQLNETTMALDVGAHAAIHHWMDEGDDHYRAYVATPLARLWFGKTKPAEVTLLPVIDHLNHFLADSTQQSADVREDIWWWFMLPIGFVFIAIGLAAALIANRVDTWLFDHTMGRIVHRWSIGLPIRRRAFLLSNVIGIEVEAKRDDEGAVFPKLMLRLRLGVSEAMYGGVTPQGSPDRAEAAAAEINRYLDAWR